MAGAASGLRVARKERLGADGINLINSCGAAAWQTVFHFHVHVIPRYEDDPLQAALGAGARRSRRDSRCAAAIGLGAS